MTAAGKKLSFLVIFLVLWVEPFLMRRVTIPEGTENCTEADMTNLPVNGQWSAVAGGAKSVKP
jgi:hypothetical protein